MTRPLPALYLWLSLALGLAPEIAASAEEERIEEGLSKLRERGIPAALAPPGPVTQLTAALRLFTKAAEAGDPLDMAAAQRLAQGITLRRARQWQMNGSAHEDRGPAFVAVSGVTLDLLLAPRLSESIEVLAEEDERLADLLATLPPVSRHGSAARADADLAAGETQDWRIAFAGQSPAEAAIFFTSDPEAEALIWSVEDQYEVVICPEMDAAKIQSCRFTPESSDFYRIKLQNRSTHAHSYALVTG